MIYGVLAPADPTGLSIPKLVCSLWLSRPRRAVLNLSTVITNQSDRALSQVTLALTDPLEAVEDISLTLMNPKNPISTFYSGEYRIGGPNFLDYYDGVPNVRVASRTTISSARHRGLFLYTVTLSPIQPGQTAAFRLLGLIPPGRCIGWVGSHVMLDLRFFDPSTTDDRTGLRGRAIPVSVRYNLETYDGGFDPFLYLPASWFMSEARPPFEHAKTDIRYDWRGQSVKGSWIRYAWQPRQTLEQRYLPAQHGYTFVPPRRMLIWAKITTAENPGVTSIEYTSAPSDEAKRVDALTEGEVRVLIELAGDPTPTNKGIGERLNLSSRTIEAHLNSIYRKLNVRDRHAAIAVARRQGLTPGSLLARPS